MFIGGMQEAAMQFFHWLMCFLFEFELLYDKSWDKSKSF